MIGIIEQQRQYKGTISESRGASGGITTLQNHITWNYRSETINQHWIKTVLENKADKQIIVIYNIYVPNHFRDKESCWDDLKASIDAKENSNIIFGGDFNLILHANEKRGGSFSPDPFRTHLENIIQDHDLIDVAPKNRRYTWSNRKLGKGNIMERLDRILINVTYLSSFSVGYANILPFSASDHYSITLTLETHCSLGPIPFKYSSLWNCIPVVKEIV